MKYLTMICRGHVPTWAGRMNKDMLEFIRYFLPRGEKTTKKNVLAAVRQLHLAFKTMETDEVYDVLMEQLLKAAAKYDPAYTEKVKRVVEVIDHALSGSKCFHAADLGRHLEYDAPRYLRLLCRRGFLVSRKEAGEKTAVYSRASSWPPPDEFFASAFTYCLQKRVA